MPSDQNKAFKMPPPPSKEVARALRKLYPEYDPMKSGEVESHTLMAYRHGQRDVRMLVEAWVNGTLDDRLGLVKVKDEEARELMGNIDVY